MVGIVMVVSVVAFDVSGVVVFVVTMLPFDVVRVVVVGVSVVTSDFVRFVVVIVFAMTSDMVGAVVVVISAMISDVIGVFEGCVLTEDDCVAKNKYSTKFTTIKKCRIPNIFTILEYNFVSIGC